MRLNIRLYGWLIQFWFVFCVPVYSYAWECFGGNTVVQDTLPKNGDSVTLRIITLEEAYSLYRSRKGFFVDSRAPFFYNRAHIRDAIPICYRCTDTSQVMRALGKNDLLIVYCSGAHCDQAQMLIQKLLIHGFKNIYWFKGGMEEWRAAGYPIEEKEPLFQKSNQNEKAP